MRKLLFTISALILFPVLVMATDYPAGSRFVALVDIPEWGIVTGESVEKQESGLYKTLDEPEWYISTNEVEGNERFLPLL